MPQGSSATNSSVSDIKLGALMFSNHDHTLAFFFYIKVHLILLRIATLQQPIPLFSVAKWDLLMKMGGMHSLKGKSSSALRVYNY